MPKIATLGESFNQDVIDANMTLGHLAKIRFDYDSAAEAFQADLAVSKGTGCINALLYRSKRTPPFPHTIVLCSGAAPTSHPAV